MTDTPQKPSLIRKINLKAHQTIPSVIPYLSKKGQLLLPTGLLPILIKTPADRQMVEKALKCQRTLGIIQPITESKNKKQLYQIGCVGRITTFSENEDGSLYIILKGLKRFTAVAIKSGLLQVDYTNYKQDQTPLEDTTPKDRHHLMGLLKNYFDHINLEIDWQDLSNATDESLVTSLTMMCPFQANEKQAILESSTLEERLNMITAFIEMSEIKKVPHTWALH